MGQFGIGQPVARVEDARLLQGRGRFVNIRNLAGHSGDRRKGTSCIDIDTRTGGKPAPELKS